MVIVIVVVVMSNILQEGQIRTNIIKKRLRNNHNKPAIQEWKKLDKKKDRLHLITSFLLHPLCLQNKKERYISTKNT